MYRTIIFVVILGLLCDCQQENGNSETPEQTSILKELKVDSLKSILTTIIDDGTGLSDFRAPFSKGMIRMDDQNQLRFLGLTCDSLYIDSVRNTMNIEMINIESWDSSSQYSLKQDSAFLLRNPTHISLTQITVGEVSNEVVLFLQVQSDSIPTQIEGKTSLNLRDWNREISEERAKLHLGFVIYPLTGKN